MHVSVTLGEQRESLYGARVVKKTVKSANIGKLERLTGNETMLVIIISEHVRRRKG